jgi:DNA repair photolyase
MKKVLKKIGTKIKLVLLIEKIVGESIAKIKDTGQRDSCGCFKSKDIGGYTGIFRCKHNCDYCYASPAKK